jgi:hypothetical protein
MYIKMQNSDKSDNTSADDLYFDELLPYYHSIGWKPFRFRRRRTTTEKVIAHINKTTKLINKVKSRELACITRAKSLPENATIRKEFIKCRKELCEELHGPYYYAYWKDNDKKLNKKYIGAFLPTRDDTKFLKNNH